MDSILVERDKKAFARLKKFAADNSGPEFEVHALCGDFVDQVPRIAQIIKGTGKNPFRFVFLDPTGWADIPMRKLQPLLHDRSCEVLINLMTRHIVRFLEEPDREGSYTELFGREEVVDLLRSTPREERQELAVAEYCRSLKLLCDFKYVSSAVILDPEEESVRYYLVYATHHPRGVEVFKTAEMKASRIQDRVRHETHVKKTRQEEFAFDGGPPRSQKTHKLRQKYSENARNRIMQVLAAESPGGIPYSDLFCEAMAFPLVTPDDLENWLRDLTPSVEIMLAGSPRRRKPSPLKDDRVFVRNPQALRLKSRRGA